jgi:3-hydroxy-9,10-secoandrosta-1,3,5(10)-triene-9,17-dione monooxygenase
VKLSSLSPNTAPGGADCAIDAAEQRTELVEAARSVVPVLRRNAELADRDSRLTAEATTALRTAGLFRLGAPKMFGGHEAGLVATLDVTSTVGLGCASSAWVLALTHATSHIAAGFGPVAREEVWGAGTDFGMCGSFTGHDLTARKVDGGQVVSGRWPMASGAYQAGWAAVGIGIGDEQGEDVDRGVALIPTTALEIDDTWDMAGMRGTGSHTLVADSVFIPDHRLRRFAAVLGGPAEAVEPLYRVPLGSMPLMLVGPMLGSAQAAFDLVMEKVAAGKPMAMSNYGRLADPPSVQAALADAATFIDTARLHLYRSADMLDATAASGGAVDPLARARVRMDAGHASACLRSAMELLLTVGGASSMAVVNPLQRHWRDLETAARQPTINSGLSREIYGRAIVGSSEQVSFLV